MAVFYGWKKTDGRLRRDLFDQLSDVPGLDIASIDNIDDDTLYYRLLSCFEIHL